MVVLNVFCDNRGLLGNPVGIIEDIGKKIENAQRQRMAKESGFSEIVFVNNINTKDISIFSPTREIPFAGHAVIGASYYLRHKHNLDVSKITSMGTVIETWEKDNLTWVKTEQSTLPKWNFREVKTPSEVESLTLDTTKNLKHTYVWSWINKEKGLVRARTFASDWMIPEDEANGSGSIMLANTLEANLTIHHGKGSIIHTIPNTVGGFVKEISE